MQLSSCSDQQTQQWGAAFARILFPRNQPIFVWLQGDLGAGKTTWARGFINQWISLCQEEQAGAVTSPTYNLVQIYGHNRPVAHLDLYRIEDLEELEQIGFEHLFYETPVCLVEWFEKIPEATRLLPKQYLLINFSTAENTRILSVEGSLQNEIREELLQALKLFGG